MAYEPRHKNNAIIVSTVLGERGTTGFVGAQGATGDTGADGAKGPSGGAGYGKVDVLTINKKNEFIQLGETGADEVEVSRFLFTGTSLAPDVTGIRVLIGGKYAKATFTLKDSDGNTIATSGTLVPSSHTIYDITVTGTFPVYEDMLSLYVLVNKSPGAPSTVGPSLNIYYINVY